MMSEPERERVLRKVDELYDDYGRGADGMLLPYVTHCYRAVVRAAGAWTATTRPPTVRPRSDDGGDADALLIDFQ